MTSTEEPDRSHRDLYAAIGRVASASAEMEQTLRFLLDDLIGISDAVWILFEGQSTDSLIRSCRSILQNGDGLGEWGSHPYHGRLIKLLQECDGLRPRRNVVIHGTWRNHCDYEREAEENRECILRPPDSPEDERIYYFRKSSQRPRFGDTHLAVIDIEALADEFQGLEHRIWALRRKVNEDRRNRWKLMEERQQRSDE